MTKTKRLKIRRDGSYKKRFLHVKKSVQVPVLSNHIIEDKRYGSSKIEANSGKTNGKEVTFTSGLKGATSFVWNKWTALGPVVSLVEDQIRSLLERHPTILENSDTKSSGSESTSIESISSNNHSIITRETTVEAPPAGSPPPSREIIRYSTEGYQFFRSILSSLLLTSSSYLATANYENIDSSRRNQLVEDTILKHLARLGFVPLVSDMGRDNYTLSRLQPNRFKLRLKGCAIGPAIFYYRSLADLTRVNLASKAASDVNDELGVVDPIFFESGVSSPDIFLHSVAMSAPEELLKIRVEISFTHLGSSGFMSINSKEEIQLMNSLVEDLLAVMERKAPVLLTSQWVQSIEKRLNFVKLSGAVAGEVRSLLMRYNCVVLGCDVQAVVHKTV